MIEQIISTLIAIIIFHFIVDTVRFFKHKIRMKKLHAEIDKFYESLEKQNKSNPRCGDLTIKTDEVGQEQWNKTMINFVEEAKKQEKKKAVKSIKNILDKSIDKKSVSKTKVKATKVQPKSKKKLTKNK